MSTTIKARHGGQTADITLQPSDDPYVRIAEVFSLQVSRIKLIRAGKKLPSSGCADLADAIRQPGILMVLSSDALPTRSERALGSIRSNARLMWESLTLEAVQFFSRWFVTWLWSCVASASRAAVAFVSSAVVAPPPAGHREHERQD